MFKEFSKFIKEEKAISNLKNDEELKKEFSSWVKEYEKKTNRKEKYDQYNQFKSKVKSKEVYFYIIFSIDNIIFSL